MGAQRDGVRIEELRTAMKIMIGKAIGPADILVDASDA